MPKSPISAVTLTGEGANPAVTVVPTTTDTPSAPVPSYPMDPSTGFAKSVIEKGECPENSLGDTNTQPISFNTESPAPQDSYGPSFGKGGASE